MTFNLKAAHATLSLLASTWPACLSAKLRNCKPLKVGIGKEIAAAAEGAITAEELDAALSFYTGSKAYLRALKVGAVRIGLDGAPAGTVTADEAAFARVRIERKEARESAKVRARGLAIEAAALKAKAEAEEAKRAAEEAKWAAESVTKRKPLLRLPRPEPRASAAAATIA